ncbi:methionine--tRNA ligase [Acetobacteraceae bacterium]|nr:methionine--tRNA ligase [Acetobacteraceae bacterium]
MTKNTYMVTTPIFYVNGNPHIGHAYTSIAADILARFKRLDGKDVLFETGTDEYGQKVERSAQSKNITPKLFTDQVSAEFKKMQDSLNVQSDFFVRTTSEIHKHVAQSLWKKIAEKGYIYLGFYEGWYSARDEAFIGEDELKTLENGEKTTLEGAPVEYIKEPSYFFKLSAFTEKLLDFYKENPDFIAPYGARNEIESFVKQGLRDLSVSRTSFKWGIPVPGDEAHVMYVWFDALSNYLTAVGYPDTESEKFKKFWPPEVHLVGKEITRFHCIYWPAFLMAADLELPKKVFAHGWWTVEGQKMSKSIGNVLDPLELSKEFGVDALRYFLMREVPFGGDANFSRSSLITRINTELANDLGNLAQRVLSFIAKNKEGKLPGRVELSQEDLALLNQARILPELLSEYMDRVALSQGIEKIWEVIRAANAYIDHQAPWKLRKVDTERMIVVLWVLVEALRYIATLLQPYMPEKMSTLLDILAVPPEKRTFEFLKEPLNREEILFPQPVPLFPRIEILEKI